MERRARGVPRIDCASEWRGLEYVGAVCRVFDVPFPFLLSPASLIFLSLAVLIHIQKEWFSTLFHLQYIPIVPYSTCRPFTPTLAQSAAVCLLSSVCSLSAVSLLPPLGSRLGGLRAPAKECERVSPLRWGGTGAVFLPQESHTPVLRENQKSLSGAQCASFLSRMASIA